ncbi:TorF family putative porin [Cupriavidus basilensis]
MCGPIPPRFMRGIGYGPVFLKYSYAPTNPFGFADSKHSWYADLSANVPLNVWG